jgi:hypothetical protein
MSIPLTRIFGAALLTPVTPRLAEQGKRRLDRSLFRAFGAGTVLEEHNRQRAAGRRIASASIPGVRLRPDQQLDLFALERQPPSIGLAPDLTLTCV